MNTICLLFLTFIIATKSQNPVINKGRGTNFGWKKVWADEFHGSGAIGQRGTDWRFEKMVDDNLHQSGNNGIDRNGKRHSKNWVQPKGKRWSLWYDKHTDRTAKRVNGKLELAGYVVKENDPTRPNSYRDKGEGNALIEYGKYKFYGAWVDTWARKWSQAANGMITDPDSPDGTYKYGFFEFKVDFSKMHTPGFRFSIWLLPAYDDNGNLKASNAYNGNPKDGVEIDIFEYEVDPNWEQILQMKVINPGGGWGSTKPDWVDASKLNPPIDLRKGSHIVGLMWEKDRLTWYLDGREVNHDSERVPQVWSYLVLSREGNSGVVGRPDQPDDPVANVNGNSYIPLDVGLYKRNMFVGKDRFNSDKAILDYARVWSRSGTNNNPPKPGTTTGNNKPPNNPKPTESSNTPAVTELRNSWLSTKQVKLEWFGKTRNYQISRRDLATKATKQFSTKAEFYADFKFDAGHKYEYCLYALSGNKRSVKRCITVQTKGTPAKPPAKPPVKPPVNNKIPAVTELRNSWSSTTSTKLEWFGKTGNYLVSRADTNGKNRKEMRVKGGKWTDKNFAGGRVYKYCVVALQGSSRSPERCINVRTQGSSPQKPQNKPSNKPSGPKPKPAGDFRNSWGSKIQLKFEWEPLDGSGLLVRKDLKSGLKKQFSVKGTSYSDFSVQAGRTYQYCLTVTKNGVKSDPRCKTGSATSNWRRRSAVAGAESSSPKAGAFTWLIVAGCLVATLAVVMVLLARHNKKKQDETQMAQLSRPLLA